jgi:hypothetical protein
MFKKEFIPGKDGTNQCRIFLTWGIKTRVCTAFCSTQFVLIYIISISVSNNPERCFCSQF